MAESQVKEGYAKLPLEPINIVEYQSEKDVEKALLPKVYGTFGKEGEQKELERKGPFTNIFKSLMASLLVVGVMAVCGILAISILL